MVCKGAGCFRVRGLGRDVVASHWRKVLTLPDDGGLDCGRKLRRRIDENKSAVSAVTAVRMGILKAVASFYDCQGDQRLGFTKMVVEVARLRCKAKQLAGLSRIQSV